MSSPSLWSQGCAPRCPPMHHWWCTFRLCGTQPPESRRSEDPMLSLPWEGACKGARWCCMRCTMVLEFLTLGDSVTVVLCLSGLTLSDWCVVRSEDGDVQCFSERMSWLVHSIGFGAKRRVCHLALKPGCLAQGASAWDTGRDGWVLRVGLPRMFGPFTVHMSIPNCWDPWNRRDSDADMRAFVRRAHRLQYPIW